MNFNLDSLDLNSKARAGTIKTDHGNIETPIFMPVGTAATVKGVHQRDIKNEINPDIILSNTYHLYLRPGHDLIAQAGGIHKFMNWDRNILTDSGGYQVYSLANSRKIHEEGVEFKSHIDGSKHFFSPERAIKIQKLIGADIIMAFDECPPYPCDHRYAKKSMELTHRWLDRCIKEFNNVDSKYDFSQTMFPIALGVDMFDCVMPSRNARNGMIFTLDGSINIKNLKWRHNFEVLDENNYSFVDLNYSKAYLRHLFIANEALGRQIATIHNLAFYVWLVKEARKQIIAGSFSTWKSETIKRLNNKL
jgi:queuine/archaeosine tRNA-ribosyltransferase